MSDAVKIANGTFTEANHEYRNSAGIPVPSVTQILEGVGLTDLSGIPLDTLERKRALGDAVHYGTAILDRCKYMGGPELDWDTVHEDAVPYMLAYERFQSAGLFVPEEVEHGGIFTVNGMEFGFTRDRIGRMQGIKHRVLLEIKCSYREEPAWKYQLAGYDLTVPRAKDEYIVRVAVQLKPDTTFKCFPYEKARDRDRFLWALGLTYVKIEEGLDWKK
jgi:hypothetical protein